MTASPSPPPQERSHERPRAVFKPRFTVMLLYLVAFFSLYCFAFMVPVLGDVLELVPARPDPEGDKEALEAASRVVQEAVQPRLLVAFLAALLTVGAGSWKGHLPGTR